MNKELKDVLTSYKECTLEIIQTIEDNKLDSLEELIEERQRLLDKALSVTDQSEKSKQIYKELGLDELQEKLNTLMLKKLDVIRSKMQKISKSKVANNAYNKRNCVSASIFSKRL